MHSPALALAVVPPPPGLVVTVPPPALMLTDGPLGPMVVVPLSPPGPLPIVVVLLLEPECCGDAPEPWDDALSAATVRHGRSLSTMMVVPPLLPVTTETLAPAPAAVEVLSASAPALANAATPAIIRVAATAARMTGLLQDVS